MHFGKEHWVPVGSEVYRSLDDKLKSDMQVGNISIVDNFNKFERNRIRIVGW